MAYEHGSIKLDIDNPFTTEGRLRTVSGIIITVYGIYLLLGVVDRVEESRMLGWGQLAVAGIALILGLRQAGKGLMQVFRFYVGRGIPLSLTPDQDQTNPDLQALERTRSRYRADELESMLLGRKNTTFEEPQGFIPRLVHSLLPRLLFLPFIHRNLAIRLATAVFSSLIALTAYALITFVTSSGLLVENSLLIRTIAQWVILLYLLRTWYKAARLDNDDIIHLQRRGAGSIAWPLLLSVALPLALAQFLASLPRVQRVFDEISQSQAWQQIQGVSATTQLLLLVLLSLAATAVIAALLWERMKLAQPSTEVSEYRELWQQDVNPREIFIALENIVLANRRYREIPNRIYKALEPRLQEQADGKGEFSGDLMVETQPAPKAIEYSARFRALRLIATITGSLLVLIALLIFLGQTLDGLRLMQQIQASGVAAEQIPGQINQGADILNRLLLAASLLISGRLLRNNTHWFWAELNFESLLINFSCSGTFRETRFTTGKGIYDSTQSDNQVIRSDITPWVTLSRVTSSTYAGIGSLNLEGPRIILQMQREETELQSIIQELLDSFEKREKVASIQNENDLKAIDQINTINRIAKGHLPPEQLLDSDGRIAPVLGKGVEDING